jgi:biotin transport system substrate-specific component
MKNELTLGQLIFPETGLTEDLLVAFTASAFIAVLSQVSVHFSVVPSTGFTLGIFLIALLFGVKRGVMAVLLYFLEVAIGLPGLPGLLGGWQRLILPNAGYFVGALIATIVLGNLARRGWTRSPALIFAATLIGTILIYLVALPWLGVTAPEIPFPPNDQIVGENPGLIVNILKAGLFPFLMGDVLKIVVCTLVISIANRFAARADVDKKLELR